MSTQFIQRAPSKQTQGFKRHPGLDWIHSQYAQLPNNQWVAASGDGRLWSGDTVDIVLEKLAAANVGDDEVAFAFVTRDLLY